MLDSPTVRRGCQDVLDALGRAREEIDALNVYPVPDGDTGTNLFLTVESAVEELLARPDDADVGADLRALAHGALLGARGNSGVILSQLLRGAAAGAATPAPGRRGRGARPRWRVPPLAGYARGGRAGRGDDAHRRPGRGVGRDRGQCHRPGQRRARAGRRGRGRPGGARTHPGAARGPARGRRRRRGRPWPDRRCSTRSSRRRPGERPTSAAGRAVGGHAVGRGSRRPASRGTGRRAGPSSR